MRKVCVGLQYIFSFLRCEFKEGMGFLPSVPWVWFQNDSGFRSRTQTWFSSVISEH